MATEKKLAESPAGAFKKVKITDAYGIGYFLGEEVNVPESEANRLIESGKAVAVTEKPAE